MNKIKYGFIGSHGTGKSSAATHLAAKLKQENRDKSVKVLEENVREISKLFNNKLNTPEFQKMCMVDHLQKEFLSEQLYDIIVCDRTALDTLVYGLMYGITLPPEYFSLALNHLNTFTHIYFIRPDLENATLVNDGFRDTDIKMRDLIDIEFERFLKMWGGKYTEVRTSEVFTFSYGLINKE